MNISLIINTHNQPEYLARVLAAVAQQAFAADEVLLADDGSDTRTEEVFQRQTRWKKFKARHYWQPHQGFNRSRILNKAIAGAWGDYIVFLDGDTIPHPNFLDDHRLVARQGYFVQGHRALIGKKAAQWFGKNALSLFRDRRRALLRGQISGVKNAFRWPLAFCRDKNHLRGIRGCNLAVWRDDLIRVNGYNEAFTGWGREDTEIAVRLMNSGVKRLDARGRAICYHLWHPPASRDRLSINDSFLENAINSHATRCEQGLDSK